MDNWLPLQRLGGLIEKRLAWLSKNWDKNLIKPGLPKRFLEFCISHQKREKKQPFIWHFSIPAFIPIRNREGQTHTQMQNNESITARACWISQKRTSGNFQKGDSSWILLLPELLGLLHLVLYGALELWTTGACGSRRCSVCICISMAMQLRSCLVSFPQEISQITPLHRPSW